jgi:hypothetical protein
LRILSNLETDKDKLLKIIIAGQSQMKNRLYKLGDLKQRIALITEIGGLAQDETADYINHYLDIAGGKKLTVSKNLANTIWEATGGTPRLVNMLMERALVAAFMDKADGIKRIHVESAVKSMNMLNVRVDSPERPALKKILAVAGAVLALAGGSFAAYNVLGNSSTKPPVVIVDATPAQDTPTEPIAEQPVATDPVVAMVDNNTTADNQTTTADPAIDTPDVLDNTTAPVETPPVVVDNQTTIVEPAPVTPPTPVLAEGMYGVGNVAVVRTNSLNVRAIPSTNGRALGSVKGGQELVVKEENQDWIKFDFNANTEGWVHKDYLQAR